MERSDGEPDPVPVRDGEAGEGQEVVVGIVERGVDQVSLAEDVAQHGEAAPLPAGQGQDGLGGVPGPVWASLITRCTPPSTAVSASINAWSIVWAAVRTRPSTH